MQLEGRITARGHFGGRNTATQRGRDKFPIVPLSLNGTRLGVLEVIFGEEPLYIPVSSGAGGVEAAMNAILVAVRQRSPADIPATARRKAQPLEELVLELSDLKFHEQDSKRRAPARARLVYEPAMPEKPHVYSAQTWRLIAPLGPIEAEELRWYLEKYAATADLRFSSVRRARGKLFHSFHGPSRN